jgi:hypothetical protein
MRADASGAGFGLVLEEIFDAVLVDQEIGGVVTIELDAVSVVPLDVSLNGLAVREYDAHQDFFVHLFQIVVVFGMGVIARMGFFLLLAGIAGRLLFIFRKVGTDKLPVHRYSPRIKIVWDIP